MSSTIVLRPTKLCSCSERYAVFCIFDGEELRKHNGSRVVIVLEPLQYRLYGCKELHHCQCTLGWQIVCSVHQPCLPAAEQTNNATVRYYKISTLFQIEPDNGRRPNANTMLSLFPLATSQHL